jgi:D-sedoheptulose 7-phosphate isomerase
MIDRWEDYVAAVAGGLRELSVTDGAGDSLPPAEAFTRWVEMTHETHQRGGFVYLIGNGGSAAMASHMAADACKHGDLRALAFNDVAMLTATANDLAYDQVFALPLQRLARPTDLLISISSSGNSPNIVRALEAARELGVAAVTLSGKGADNRSRALGQLNFHVPRQRYGWIESAHQILIHYWLDRYLTQHAGGAI